MKKSPSKRKPHIYRTAAERECGDKAAESLAVYTRTRRRTAASAAQRIASIAASDEVWRFAARNDLIPHLETAVRLAKKCFRQIEGFHFTYDIDPEIENESYVTIRATVHGGVEELLPQDWAMTQALVRTLPKDKLHYIHFAPTIE